jgi:flagellar basal body rod protein FlgB
MEQLLERILQLEKRVQMLEKRDTNNEINDFKETIKLISVSTEHLTNVFNSSMDQEIVNILIKTNSIHNFLQYKKHVFKCENGNTVKVDDDDYKYMFEYVEYLLIKEFHQFSLTLKSDDFFEKNKIIYSLNLSKNFKKVKTLFLQAL